MQTIAHKISKNNVALICIILLLGFAAHAGMLTASFKTLDDDTSIISNSDIKDVKNIGKIFTTSFFGGKHYYRPMVSLSFMTEYHSFGLRPFFYNLTNLALHLAVVVTVFFLIFILLEDRAAAFFTSLLFAVHPIHWEAVSNIPGRAILLSTFFTINAFFFFCLSEERRRCAVCYGLSLILFTCGLLSKESAVMMPVLLLSYMFFSEKSAKRYPLVIPFFVIIAAYIIFRKSLGIMETYPWRSSGEHALGFVTFLRAVLTFLRLLVWPVGLHFDRAQQMFLKFSDPGLFSTLIAFLAIGIALLKFRKQMPGYVLFFVSWFAIELFPVSQIITTIGVGPGYISAAEHFLYSPSVGIFVLIVLGAKRIYSLNRASGLLSPNVYRTVIAGGLASLMLITFYQETFSLTALSMYRRTLEYNPNNARILFSTGIEMVNRERYAEAEGYFRRAVERESLHVAYRLALGRALYDQGKVVEAIHVFDGIRDAGGLDPLLKSNLSEAYAEAIARYQSLILREPGNAAAQYSLGTMYSRTGRIEESVEQYKRAVALKPSHRSALFNLASSYGILGREDEAIEYYRRMLAAGGERDHLEHNAYLHLGGIYQRRGDEVQAQKYFKKAEAMK
ncbi:MAG: tetratricopeptide repeat protein [Candidatus Omnitrophica bacterium]|nr:tetratricopeptide repeat protein [Candidatus Omnitrophota bacterium]